MASEEVRGSFCRDDSCVITDQLATDPGALERELLFKQRAEQILWCYANANRLAKKGFLVVCVDEIANFQVLERSPIKPAIPGMIEHQEFEYIRHVPNQMV